MDTPTRSNNRPLVESKHPNWQAVLIAGCFGLFFGLAEGLIDWFGSIVPDQLGFRNDLLPQILWIAPTFNFLFFVTLAGPVLMLSRVFPKVRRDLFVCAIFGWLSVYGALSMPNRLNRVACALLALGVAVQLCRYVRRRTLSTVFVMRIFIGLSFLVLLMNLLGVVTKVGKANFSKLDVGAVPPDAPNVLLITLDTLRADHLSSYGYSRSTTPNLDKFAREGVLFENAFATASWTLPSHASIMTGRYLYEHRAGGGPLGTKMPTLAETLSAHGYATAGFVANHEYCGAKTGLSRGFSTYEDHYATVTDMVSHTHYGKMALSTLPWFGYYDYPDRKHASEVNREFFSWLEANRGTRFFAFLNYFDVHDPYVAPGAYETKFSDHPTKGRLVNSILFPRDFTGGRKFTDQAVQAERDDYDGCLAYLDNELGSLFDRLKVLGLLDNTLIIVTSDHGESFGDHGFFGHGNALYRNVTRVPLIVRYPRNVPTALRVSEAVSLQTIPASVMDLLGFDSQSPFPGTPLSKYWSHRLTDHSESPTLAFAESLKGIVYNPAYPLGRRGITKSLSSSKWNLLLHEEGDLELFDVALDPEELNNLANTPEGKVVIKQFAPKMKGLMPPDDWKLFCHELDSCDLK